jgi:hypothetical protein
MEFWQAWDIYYLFNLPTANSHQDVYGGIDGWQIAKL